MLRRLTVTLLFAFLIVAATWPSQTNCYANIGSEVSSLEARETRRPSGPMAVPVSLGDKLKKELWKAIADGETNTVKTLLAKGADPNAKMDRGARPLMLAAAKDSRLEILELLLQAKADVHLKDKDGDTALHWSAGAGAAKCAEALLEAGADRTVKNNLNRTPLVIAALVGRAATLKVLLEKNADLNEPVAAFTGNVTVLMLMVGAAGPQDRAKDDVEGVRFLLDCGADPNRATDQGFTALMYAAQAGRLEDVRLLLDRGANPSTVTRKNVTAVMFARVQNRTATVKLLESFAAQGKQALSAPIPLSVPGAAIINGTTVWKGEPPAPYVVIAEDAIEEVSTTQVSPAETGKNLPTELDDTLRLVETRIIPKVGELGAEAIILRDATTAYTRIEKPGMNYGTALNLMVMSNLAGIPLVVFPGGDKFFVEKTNKLSYVAIKFVPPGMSSDEVKRQLEAEKAKRPAIVYLFLAKDSKDDECIVVLDGSPLAKLRRNRFIKVKIEHGSHKILLTKSNPKSGIKDSEPLTLDVKGGETYYVAMNSRMGGPSVLEIYDSGSGAKQLRQPIEPKDVLDRARVILP